MLYHRFLVVKTTPDTERHLRVFRNSRNRPLRISHEFELDRDEAILRKEGDRLIIAPGRQGLLHVLLASLAPLEEPFPDVDEDLTRFEDEATR